MALLSKVVKSGGDGAIVSSKPPLTREDHIVRGAIISVGLLTFVLLAWVHLGLGAWLFPPAPTAAHQVAVAGPYHITLEASSGQLTAHGPNTLTFVVQNQQAASSSSLSAVQLSATGTMTTMNMQAPVMTITKQGAGHFILHPLFVMAGDWRLTFTITQPGLPNQHVSFIVSVRWS